jgi:hypothetical protein
METNVRIFHVKNIGMIIGTCLSESGAGLSKVEKPRLMGLRPHPNKPEKSQLTLQVIPGAPDVVFLKASDVIMDYPPGDTQFEQEYIRNVTGIVLATELPKGKA